MARQVEGPWFRKSKETWFCTRNGKKVSLKVRGEDNKAEAVKAWHRLMAGEPTGLAKELPKPEAQPQPKPEVLTVQKLVDSYLEDAKPRIGGESYRGYAKFLTPFATQFGSRQAESITPTEAEGFARNHKPAWSTSYQAGFLGTLVTAFKWAVQARLLGANPVSAVRKPPKASRGKKAIISDDERQQLLATADPLFRDFLTVLWATGARPGEVSGLTAEMVRTSAEGIIPLESHKEAHKGKSRLLILTGEALTIVQQRAEAQKTGLLFVGKYGPLTPKAVSAKMSRLCEKAGVRRCIAYGFRHTFATDALRRGVPDATVAALLGHSSTAMLHKHYSHLGSQAQALRDALVKVRAA